MPFFAHVLGYERRWRKGATPLEIASLDRLVDRATDSDRSLADIQTICIQMAEEFPEAALQLALRDEMECSLFIEVADGDTNEWTLELIDPRRAGPIDPEADELFPELATTISADLIEAEVLRRYGPCVESFDDTHLIVPVDQPDIEACANALGVVAQLLVETAEVYIRVNELPFIAVLDPGRGCELAALERRHHDDDITRRFLDIANATERPQASMQWRRPPLPDPLSHAEPARAALKQVPDAPLSSGAWEDRLAALYELAREKPEGWIAEVLAAAESSENASPRYSEVRAELYRTLARVADPRVADLLWCRLRSEHDELAAIISHIIWQQPLLVTRLPQATLEQWHSNREYASRLLQAAVDANQVWPDEFADRTPPEARMRLQSEGLWPS